MPMNVLMLCRRTRDRRRLNGGDPYRGLSLCFVRLVHPRCGVFSWRNYLYGRKFSINVMPKFMHLEAVALVSATWEIDQGSAGMTLKVVLNFKAIDF